MHLAKKLGGALTTSLYLVQAKTHTMYSRSETLLWSLAEEPHLWTLCFWAWCGNIGILSGNLAWKPAWKLPLKTLFGKVFAWEPFFTVGAGPKFSVLGNQVKWFILLSKKHFLTTLRLTKFSLFHSNLWISRSHETAICEIESTSGIYQLRVEKQVRQVLVHKQTWWDNVLVSKNTWMCGTHMV